jgi:hypothetical protein
MALLENSDESTHILPMRGIEPDNLLAFLALLGLLRALEAARPEWYPRALWKGPPWVAHLSLAQAADEASVARAAQAGVELVAANLSPDDRKNVDFSRDEYRSYAARSRTHYISAALASALTSECRSDKDRLPASPLVMMFGQGHQFFLERLGSAITDNDESGEKILEALFRPWRREDDADGFRWDPEEDQRYALRYGNPSKAGAALTVAGANRLAAIGFLSFPTVPRERRIRAAGSTYQNGGWCFVWPVWSTPLSLRCVEAILNHPDLFADGVNNLRALGVTQIFRARRVTNGKYMNIARAKPIEA